MLVFELIILDEQECFEFRLPSFLLFSDHSCVPFFNVFAASRVTGGSKICYPEFLVLFVQEREKP